MLAPHNRSAAESLKPFFHPRSVAVVGASRERTAIGHRIIESLHLTPLLHKRIGVLSKGQAKRALLAFGLLAPQPILMIDEPFEGLDLKQTREASATLRECADAGRTLFLSIHQINDAARVCDRPSIARVDATERVKTLIPYGTPVQ